ncbi:MAG: hypothetical protein MRK02_15910 [Candidatus Scalindua sp.]|nr:hypothetical protein [Candidatus Scalindua sp.]
MSASKFPVSKQADRSESEHAGFVTPMRLVSLPEMAKPVTAYEIKRYKGMWDRRSYE